MFAHKKLSVWQDSMSFAVRIYRVTDTFPKSEIFGLSSQMRRSAGSIPANISEGAGRCSQREFIRFLRISSGSLAELDTHIDLAFRLNHLDQATFNELQHLMIKISSQLAGLIKSIEQSIKN
jgi:four helix bundle protein